MILQQPMTGTVIGSLPGRPGNGRRISFRIGTGLNVGSMDRFFQDFYYPGLLAAIWRGERPMPGKPLAPSPAPSLKMLVQNQEFGGERAVL